MTWRRDDSLTTAELIRRERRPLPRHDLDTVNYRAWAVAVCGAEVKHREADHARVERLLGIHVDPWDFPNCVDVGQFPHEAHAAAALLWLSHLQTHESERRTPFDFSTWRLWKPARRAAWLAKRRKLWAGFVRQVERYRAARAAIDAPVVARAA